jgi:hypothetical protein
MFSIGIEDNAQCANLSCWSEKTSEWLEQRKKEAEERHGKVLLLVEVNGSDRHTVASSVVGEEQYTNGCVNCESNVVIMDDRDSKEGDLFPSQCIDKVCFNRCSKKYEQSLAPKKPEPSKGNTEKTVKVSKSAVEADNKTAKKPSVASKPTAKVIDHEKSTIAAACFEQVKNSPEVTNSLLLALVCELTGYEGL